MTCCELLLRVAVPGAADLMHRSDQWDKKRGTFDWSSNSRVTPPNRFSFSLECPKAPHTIRSPNRLRVLARALVRCAVSRHPGARDGWHDFLERQLEAIAGDIEALICAAGCLWSLRIERLILRAPPVLNGMLFLAGLYGRRGRRLTAATIS
jgi:hypothetical protein